MTPPPRISSRARRNGQRSAFIGNSGVGDRRLGFLCRRCQFRRGLGKSAFLARAHELGAFALGGLHREDRPGALGAGLGNGQIPHGVLAVRIARAGIENLAVARFALEESALMTLGTFDAGILWLFQRLHVFALGITRAADELAVAPTADDQVRTALRALTAFDFFRLRGLFGGFVEVAGVVAVRITGAADEASAPPEADRERLAAFRTFLVEFFGGHILA